MAENKPRRKKSSPVRFVRHPYNTEDDVQVKTEPGETAADTQAGHGDQKQSAAESPTKHAKEPNQEDAFMIIITPQKDPDGSIRNVPAANLDMPSDFDGFINKSNANSGKDLSPEKGRGDELNHGMKDTDTDGKSSIISSVIQSEKIQSPVAQNIEQDEDFLGGQEFQFVTKSQTKGNDKKVWNVSDVNENNVTPCGDIRAEQSQEQAINTNGEGVDSMKTSAQKRSRKNSTGTSVRPEFEFQQNAKLDNDVPSKSSEGMSKTCKNTTKSNQKGSRQDKGKSSKKSSSDRAKAAEITEKNVKSAKAIPPPKEAVEVKESISNPDLNSSIITAKAAEQTPLPSFDKCFSKSAKEVSSLECNTNDGATSETETDGSIGENDDDETPQVKASPAINKEQSENVVAMLSDTLSDVNPEQLQHLSDMIALLNRDSVNLTIERQQQLETPEKQNVFFKGKKRRIASSSDSDEEMSDVDKRADKRRKESPKPDVDMTTDDDYDDSDENPLAILEITPEDEEAIDDMLDAKAKETGLSVVNVKSIIKEVVSNEHVLEMIKNTIEAHSEDTPDPVYEPKMTRRRLREAMEQGNVAAYQMMSPVKQPTTTAKKANTLTLLSMSFSEEEDEEYVPTNEIDSGDESNSSLNSSPRTPRVQSDSSRDAGDSFCSPVQSTLPVGSPMGPPPAHVRAKKRKLLDDLNKAEAEAAEAQEAEDKETIALRTRSKLPLTDTPIDQIEAGFQAPDTTPDMYDIPDLQELYDNDTGALDYQVFLCNIHKGEAAPLLDDETNDDDPEYDFIAEVQKENRDKEDFRDDRAVKVTKKELNNLLDEIFRDCEMLSPDEPDTPTMPDAPVSIISMDIPEDTGQPSATAEQNVCKPDKVEAPRLGRDKFNRPPPLKGLQMKSVRNVRDLLQEMAKKKKVPTATLR